MKQARELPTLHSVDLRGVGRVVLTVGPQQKVEVEGHEAVLPHVLKSFEPGRRYPEKEAVAILERFHKDTATLRRELVGYGLLRREHGEYWIES